MKKPSIPLREAKAHFSELTERAAQGEDITITKHGEPTAHLVAADAPRVPVSLSRLQAITANQPRQPDSAAESTREMRDQTRY